MVSKSTLETFSEFLNRGTISDPGAPAWDFMKELTKATMARLTARPEDHRFTRKELLDELHRQDAIASLSPAKLKKWIDRRWQDYREHVEEKGDTSWLVLKDNGERGGKGRQKLFWFEERPFEVAAEPDDLPEDLDPARITWRRVPDEKIRLNTTGRLIFGKHRSIDQRSWRGVAYFLRHALRVLGPIGFLCLTIAVFALDDRTIKAQHIVILLIAAFLLFSMKSGVLKDLSFQRRVGAYLASDFTKWDGLEALLTRRFVKGRAFIELERFEADCPICASSVRLAEGGPEWPNRIIGRCSTSPSEHVYSLDRSDRTGRHLRPELLS